MFGSPGSLSQANLVFLVAPRPLLGERERDTGPQPLPAGPEAGHQEVRAHGRQGPGIHPGETKPTDPRDETD